MWQINVVPIMYYEKSYYLKTHYLIWKMNGKHHYFFLQHLCPKLIKMCDSVLELLERGARGATYTIYVP